ncbi:MAG: endo-1,4-beta-xylanase [Candidatus Hydrogenedentales bacterium]
MALAAHAVTGTVKIAGSSGALIPYAFVGLMNDDYSMAGQATTNPSGQFSISPERPVGSGYLFVQPPAQENAEGIGIYSAQPRMYQYRGEESVAIELPAAACIVIKAYDENGNLLRWEDLRKRGLFADQFMYATDLDDRAVPAVCWPVYDKAAREKGQPRELGLPALVVEPGTPVAANFLFWQTSSYGRLHLRADNSGSGYSVGKPGEAQVIDVNVDLLKTALNDYVKSGLLKDAKLAQFRDECDRVSAEADPKARAMGADKALCALLRDRDEMQLEAARAAIPEVRSGSVAITVTDAAGKPVADCDVRIVPKSQDFLFGVFEGSPYNASAFRVAREAGFNLATVLMGWGWTDEIGTPAGASGIDQTFGISALRKMNYTVKAHGVVWLQGYGILPQRVADLPPDNLIAAAIEHEGKLAGVFGKQVAIWEAINEPNFTNEAKFTRSAMLDLFAKSAARLKQKPETATLVNSAHESGYGKAFGLYGLDNKPVEHWVSTYSTFLAEAERAGQLKNIDIIGLQFYPGFHFNESFGGLQGPATTPAAFADMVARYEAFNRDIHITEFSVPSSYGEGSTNGYWRQPWDEAVQADYAEAIFTLAFGRPSVKSISWWDLSDKKSSVLNGGLISADGKEKPVMQRLRALLGEWKAKEAAGKTDAKGIVSLTGFAGRYEAIAALPDGKEVRGEVHIGERESGTLTLAPGGAG